MQQYLVFAVSITFISWMVGMIINAMIKNQLWYQHLITINLIESKRVYKWIGIDGFKWVVKNTPFKFFNPGLTVKGRVTDLEMLQQEMTFADVSHLIGFVFVIPFAVFKAIEVSLMSGLVIMIVNVLMNLYPSLLQQQNKKRIDKFIKRSKRA
jgi:hypothetical protein